MDQLESQLAGLFAKLPNLPDSIRQTIVKITPWVALVAMIIALPAILIALGLGAVLAPFAFLGGVTYGNKFTIGLAITAILVVLEILAIPGLFKRSRAGWTYSFYAAIVSGVEQLVTLDLAGAILGTAITLYFLFQIRSYYNGARPASSGVAR